MRTHAKYKSLLIIFTVLILIILIISIISLFKGETILIPAFKEVNPHEGQVMVNDGFDFVWITPSEDVPVNTLLKSDFGTKNGKITYLGTEYTTLRGIDVSEHQLRIDWNKAASEIDFAFIRAGYRGYTEGALFTDPYFEYNYKGATENNLRTGIYFFSQAISEEEAVEEAEYVLSLLNGRNLSLPVMFDWEKIESEVNARTNNITLDIRTKCAAAFCNKIEENGYTAGIYFNRNIGYYGYDLSVLKNYSFWITVPGNYPDFYYKGEFWQYSFEEKISGIDELTDMNLMFIPAQSSDNNN